LLVVYIAVLLMHRHTDIRVSLSKTLNSQNNQRDHMEKCGCGFIWCSIPAFASRNWEKSRKNSEGRVTGFAAGVRTGASPEYASERSENLRLQKRVRQWSG